ncbi:hypothetical protein TKK_0019166 [Trichogramma kaykai]|uniref:SAC3/GANP/THP3 conserved domain-containing protein n=1 Tax=Trichogramma kaykai TaxID=54128 RepID=A0ABD2VTK6_9HYME
MDGNMQIDPDPEDDKRVSQFIFSTPTSPEKISNTGSFSNNVFTGSSKSTESSGFTFAKPDTVEISVFNFAKPTVFSNSDNNDTSMFSKPSNEVSPFAKQAVNENSSFTNPFTNTATSYARTDASESLFGKSFGSNASPFTKSITSETSDVTKPATSEPSSGKSSAEYNSPFAKPSTNETLPFAKSTMNETTPFTKPNMNEASPFAKPNMNEDSPFAKPSMTENSPFVKPTVNEASPFAKPNINEASPFVKPTMNEASPFAKPNTDEDSPFAKPSMTENSPFVKPTVNEASPFAKPNMNEDSPFAKPSMTENSPFVKPTMNEASPFAKPSINKDSPFAKPSISESLPFSKSSSSTKPTFGKSSADETSVFRKSSTSEISPFLKPSSNEAPYFTKYSGNEDSPIKETGKISIHARLSKRSVYPDEPIVITDDDTSSSETTSEKSIKRSSLRSRRTSRSDLNASDIKRTSAFTQLQKNSRKTSDIKLDLANSITCSDVPESLLVKTVAKEYFEQFGNILKLTIRPRRKIIVVYFSSKVTATKAFVKSGNFLNHEFKVEWTKPDSLSSKPKKVESLKKRITSFLNIDDDVKEELEALKGLEYNMPEPSSHIKTSIAKARVKKAMVVANREVPKRSGLISKSSLLKPSRPLLKEKSIPKPLPKAQAPVEESKLKFVTSLSIDELKKQIRQPALSSEDKYKVLDARDKLMRLKQNKQTSLATAKITQGTCPDMCPEKERYMREFQRQLATYEQMEPGSSDYKINHLTAVKQYSRSSADQEEPMAHDLRPLKSLKMTMSYLLHEISDLCDSDDVSLTEWYHYLWDRMRSIRKDITQQELCCVDTVELVEQCARFHILSSERLCAEETSVFDPKINSENLTKCLQTLKYMYYDLREAGITCKNEPEFRAYVILLNLNNGSFISDLSTLPPNIQKSDEVKFALNVYSALAMDNYSRFFKLVRQTTYLNGCILMRYFNQVRVKALNIMVKAYCRTSAITEYPLYELIDILGFEDEDEVNHFCNQTGLKCDRENLYIKLKKDNFHHPDGQIEQGRAYNLILSKRQAINQAVGQCIAGGEWPEKIHINHKPHSSFDDNGYLLRDAYNAQDQGKTDAYDMLDEDGDVEFSEVKETKKVEEKKTPVVNQTNSDFSFKAQPMQPSTFTTAPTANKPIFGQSQFSTPPSTASFKSPENKSFTSFSTPTPSAFSQSTHASTSMFNSTLPPQPQPAITTQFSNANSPFNMAVSKGIFSGYPASQTNIFAVQSASLKITTNIR